MQREVDKLVYLTVTQYRCGSQTIWRTIWGVWIFQRICLTGKRHNKSVYFTGRVVVLHRVGASECVDQAVSEVSCLMRRRVCARFVATGARPRSLASCCNRLWIGVGQSAHSSVTVVMIMRSAGGGRCGLFHPIYIPPPFFRFSVPRIPPRIVLRV